MKVIIGLVSIVLTSSILFLPSPKKVNGTIDIPTQHVYDIALESVVIKSDSIFISMDKNKSVQINALIREKDISGDLESGRKKNKVSFVKQ
jgi:hypothetical protein